MLFRSAMACVGVDAAFDEGDVAEVDFSSGAVRNVTRGQALQAQTLPKKLLDLLEAGGVYPLLERQGILSPQNK